MPRRDPIQVFISVKNLDENGDKTRDQEIALELHEYFESKGLISFLSLVSLEAMGAAEYKGTIDDALDEAAVLVAVGTSPENLNSRWVRYEWDSFFNDVISGIKPEGKVFSLISSFEPAQLPRALRQTQAFAYEKGGIEYLYNFLANALDLNKAILDRDEAERGRQDLAEVVDFLISLFKSSNPNETLGETLTARDILDQGSERIRTELNSQPTTRARMLDTIGATYQSLGLYEKAQQHKQEAYQLRLDTLGAETDDTVSSLASLAELALDRANYQEMKQYAEQAYELNRKIHGDDSLRTIGSLSDLAVAFGLLGDLQQALSYSRKVLDAARSHPDLPDKSLESYLRRFAIHLDESGRMAEAGPYHEESLALSIKVYGEMHPNVAFATEHLAMFHEQSGDFDRASQFYREALLMLSQVFADDHPEVAQTQGNVANFLVGRMQTTKTVSLPDIVEARALATSALSANRKNEPDHPNIGDNLKTLGEIAMLEKNYLPASSLFKQALDHYAKRLPGDHPVTFTTRVALGESYLLGGETKLALTTLNEVEAELAADRTIPGLKDRERAITSLIQLYKSAGDDANQSNFEKKLRLIKQQEGTEL